MIIIIVNTVSALFHILRNSFFHCVSSGWCRTWMWRCLCSLTLEKMYQNSISWVQMPLCKWFFNWPTLGETSSSPFLVKHCVIYSRYYIMSCVLLLNSRIYNISCSMYESASLRMFTYGRTDAIRSTTVDSFNFVQAMQDPAKQVLLHHCIFTVNLQFNETVHPKLEFSVVPVRLVSSLTQQ